MAWGTSRPCCHDMGTPRAPHDGMGHLQTSRPDTGCLQTSLPCHEALPDTTAMMRHLPPAVMGTPSLTLPTCGCDPQMGQHPPPCKHLPPALLSCRAQRVSCLRHLCAKHERLGGRGSHHRPRAAGEEGGLCSPFLATCTAGQWRPPQRAPRGRGDTGVSKPQPAARPTALFPLLSSKANICESILLLLKPNVCWVAAGCPSPPTRDAHPHQVLSEDPAGEIHSRAHRRLL